MEGWIDVWMDGWMDGWTIYTLALGLERADG